MKEGKNLYMLSDTNLLVMRQLERKDTAWGMDIHLFVMLLVSFVDDICNRDVLSYEEL